MSRDNQSCVIALGVAVICFICNIAYNYLYHGVSQLLTSEDVYKRQIFWTAIIVGAGADPFSSSIILGEGIYPSSFSPAIDVYKRQR